MIHGGLLPWDFAVRAIRPDSEYTRTSEDVGPRSRVKVSG